MESQLFEFGPADGAPSGAANPARGGRLRLRVPQRAQVEMRFASLDQLLDQDHRVRLVWAAIDGLDLSGWLADIKAVEGHAGRNATDPRVLVALWVYATLEGIGSARELERLCRQHLAYQWLCGGVTVNHHLLSDFRSQGGPRWDDLLTHIVASLLDEGLVTLQQVAQDGMRVRANAGKSSFRRKERLETHLEAARRQVETLRQLAEKSPDALNQRQRAARQRAADERAERIESAIRHCEELQAQREERAKTSCKKPVEARASTTDPAARVMQFCDGGYRPAYNVQ